MAGMKTQLSQLSGQHCGLSSASKYVIDRPVQWVVRLEMGKNHTRLLPDYRHKMVEFFCNPSRNPTDRVHLLHFM